MGQGVARIPKDKQEHLLLSAVAVVAAAPVVGIGLALLLVFGLGLAKELLWDWWLGYGTPDPWDLAADVAGIVIGGVLWWMAARRPAERVPRRRFKNQSKEG